MEHDEDNEKSMLASRGFWIGAAVSLAIWLAVGALLVAVFR